jgi:RNA polymerase sigma-70 factor (ECF subfamily)
MKAINDPLLTRKSLLSRLKDWNDQESWRAFFDTYWKIIYHAAVKAGLTDAEAQDVVQETILAVSKSMKTFKYDANGSFKAWLLRLTGWRIKDQFRKRQKEIKAPRPEASTSTRTATVERIADPAGQALEAVWSQEWETNLLEAAIERVKRKVDPDQYQVFHLYVVKKWPVARVSRALKVGAGRIYLTKHRINKLIKKEIIHLQHKPI